jgi:hypothetical protein
MYHYRKRSRTDAAEASKRSDFGELADKARELGYRLSAQRADAERFVVSRVGDRAIVATFSDLGAVRDWLQG